MDKHLYYINSYTYKHENKKKKRKMAQNFLRNIKHEFFKENEETQEVT